MIFLSYWFLAFVLVFFPIYWCVRNPRLRLVALGIACVGFHGHFAGPAGVIPIVVLGVATYVCGLLGKREYCVIGIALSVAALLFYKYTQFLSIQLLGIVAPAEAARIYASAKTVMPAIPPLGISFFVFEFVHYLVEVYRGHPPIKNPLHFGLFAIFWPSLVAGPIKRYGQFIPDLLKGISKVTLSHVALGLLIVSMGVVKKTIADDLTIWIEIYEPEFASLDFIWKWFFFLALAFRILCDFSGYSDMAIGYARMMGIVLPVNFNWPYLARNLADFWSRWHISLSSWIRDYIYIPLGGNRHGTIRRVLNGFIAFAICGLWHGAEWNFMAWGLMHGAGLAISQNYRKSFGLPGRVVAVVFDRVPLLGWAVTFLFVGFGWILFFYPVATALTMLRLLVWGR